MELRTKRIVLVVRTITNSMTFFAIRAIVYFFKKLHAAAFTILVLTFAGGAITFVSWLLCRRFLQDKDIPFVEFKQMEFIQYWGQLGDFFGGVLNPILSFVAILAVLYTIRIQSKELAEAREETKIANRTLIKQTQVFERQNFESVYFRMLEVHARLLSDTEVPGSRSRGRGVFVEFSKELKDFCSKKYVTEVSIKHLASELMSRGDNALGHYFRNMYQICKMIDNSRFHVSNFPEGVSGRSVRRTIKMNYDQKRFYANILRGQLSSYEMQMLLLNCLTPDGEGLKYYVEKFSMLKPLNKNSFDADSQKMFSLFDNMAFMDSEDIDVSLIMKFDKVKRAENVRRLIRL
ncbi:putative phage abortive infection protein [Pseudomonas sp. Z4-7]|uniref:putative phage abortive infection protein n=1 Tax=Pseudomonas sp. Z4-7 TaxID=2817413 RepID=UPI003DA84B82